MKEQPSSSDLKWLFIKELFLKNLMWLLLLFVFTLLSGYYRMSGARYIKDITNNIESHIMEGVWVLVFFGALAQAISYSTKLSAAIVCQYLTQKLTLEIRLKLINHLQRIPFKLFEKYKMGELQSIIRNDTNRASEYIYMLFSRILTNLSMALFSAWYMFVIDYKITIMIILISVMFGYINQKILNRMKSYENQSRKSLGELTNVVVNSCENFDTIKAYKAKDYMLQLFNFERNKYNDSILNVRVIDNYRIGIYNLVNKLSLFGCSVYLAYKSFSGNISLGDTLVYIMLLIQVLQAIEVIFRWMSRIVTSNAAWDRVNMVLSQGEQGTYTYEDKIHDINELEIQDISYSYDGKSYVLENYNMHFEKGKLYGIAGESGSGKSTLIKCILGVYDSETARILIDGQHFSQNNLLGLVSYVPSENYLFMGSIYENITLGNENISLQDCIEWADKIGISDWIDSLPKGYDTLITENGQSLSGGQKQTICILRAIVAKTPIIIMDEPFSALDREKEAMLISIFENLKFFKIIIFTSHRQISLDHCDYVYDGLKKLDKTMKVS